MCSKPQTVTVPTPHTTDWVHTPCFIHISNAGLMKTDGQAKALVDVHVCLPWPGKAVPHTLWAVPVLTTTPLGYRRCKERSVLLTQLTQAGSASEALFKSLFKNERWQPRTPLCGKNVTKTQAFSEIYLLPCCQPATAYHISPLSKYLPQHPGTHRQVTLSLRRMAVTRFCRLSQRWLPSCTICFSLLAVSVRFSRASRRYCLLMSSSCVSLS